MKFCGSERGDEDSIKFQFNTLQNLEKIQTQVYFDKFLSILSTQFTRMVYLWRKHL